MSNKIEVIDGVVHFHSKHGVVLLDAEDYERLKKAGGYIGVRKSARLKRLDAIINIPFENAAARSASGHRPRYTTYLAIFVMSPPRKMTVDHKDGNTLDNRKSNLRLATKRQNAQNRKKHSNNEAGFKGVSKCGSQWQAKIKLESGVLSLGKSFPSAEMAARVYDLAAIEHFGEFARLNFSKEEAERWKPHWEEIRGFFS